jgi:hypothetical protein
MKKKSRESQEIARLNRAAFLIGVESVRSGRLELLLEETLSQVFGVLGDSLDASTCTEFTCNVYAPPPPPPAG